MTTETITLSSFLLARIAEDEETARAALSVGDPSWRATLVNPQTGETVLGAFVVSDIPFAQLAITETGYPPHAAHIARHDPARVLAECAAKRVIVDLHAAYPTPQVMVYGTITACSECGSADDSPIEWPCPTLRHLAAVYSDHPEFREEWRP